jgi:ABC-type glycerol-3-phosphate transport system permease component
VIVTVTLGMIFAYAFTRYDFRGKKAIFYLVLAGIPLSMGSAALVIPNYLLFSYLNLANKWFTLPLIYITYNLPMACWILVCGLRSIPYSIEEAAAIDGASKLYIIGVLIPRLSLPTLACAGLLSFIGAWNEFIISSVLVSSPKYYPIQVSIYNYMGFFGREWGPLMASATIGVIPIIIVFAFFGNLLISGLTAGAVKE